MENYSSYIDKYKKSQDILKPIYQEGLENARYLRGDNWSKRDIEKHNKQGFQAFNIPLIAVKINRILALQRQNRFESKARGRGEEDELTAEVLNLLLKFVDDDNNGKYQESDVYLSGIAKKYGVMEVWTDFNENPLGDIRFKSIPFEYFYWDTNSRCYDLHEDATFMGVHQQVPFQTLKQMFPKYDWKYSEAYKNYEDLKGNITDWCDPKTSLTKLCNHYDVEYKQKYLVKNIVSGDFQAYGSRSDAEDYIRESINNAGKELIQSESYSQKFTEDDFKIFPKMLNNWKHIVFSGSHVVQEEDWQYSKPPYFRYCSMFDDGELWSLTDLSKDSQKAYDRMIAMIDKSVAKNIKGNNYTLNPDWLHPKESKNVDEVNRRLSNGGGVALVTRHDAYNHLQSGNNVHVESQLAVNYQTLIEDLLGGRTFQGLEAPTPQTATEIKTLEKNSNQVGLLYMDNLARFKKTFTSYLVEVIKDLYTPGRTFRVLGEIQSKKVLETLQSKGIYKESNLYQGSYGWIDLSKVKPLSNCSLDIIIEDVESTNSEKDNKFNQLIAVNTLAVQSGYPPLPFEYLLQYTKLDPTVKNGLSEWQQEQNKQIQMQKELEADKQKGDFLVNLLDKTKPQTQNNIQQNGTAK